MSLKVNFFFSVQLTICRNWFICNVKFATSFYVF